MPPLKQWIRTSMVNVLTPMFDQLRGELREELRTEMQRNATAIQDERAETSRFLRSEFVEIHRMLRQQGDAADEVAETLGRTFVRLSSEVEELGAALDRLGSSGATTAVVTGA